jgi:DNA polymerase II large subunit
MDEYFARLEAEAKKVRDIAAEGRKRGMDPDTVLEVPFAEDMAARVEGLVGPPGIAERIRDLSVSISEKEVAMQVAGEIVKGDFGSFDSKAAACEQALRTSLAVLTEGIVAAPLEGIIKTEIKKNTDGSEYLAIYFAGPIRSAGGSAQAFAVLTGDYIRRSLGLAAYRATPEEMERFAEETDLYHEEAARLQYHPTPREVRKAIRNIPVEITGEATEKVEVSGYRDLPRIETNQLRGGAVLVLAEGVLQKAPKLVKFIERFELDGWEWLMEKAAPEESEKTEETSFNIEPSYKFIKDLIAGRPVLAHPSAKGGFRLRYGRSRVSGFAAMSVSPATLALLGDFIAIGTQMKTERPGKGTAVSPCDSIEGPIVKLADGSVIRVETRAQAREVRSGVKEILFLGDLLVNYGDFLENNHPLMPAGYCEEWWVQELAQAAGEGSPYSRFLDPEHIPTPVEAVEISEATGVPLHPRYTYFYHDLTKEELYSLASWLVTGELDEGRLVLHLSEEKRTLELLGVPHRLEDGRIVIEEHLPLLRSLGLHPELTLDGFKSAFEKSATSMELVNGFGITVREKAPTYIGARMGRPEKAKERRMSPPVNTLFPIGQAGGRTRDVKKAAQAGTVQVEAAGRVCPGCKRETHATLCPACGKRTETVRTCIKCGRAWPGDQESCRNPACAGAPAVPYKKQDIPLKEVLEKAIGRVGNTTGDLKGVIGMTSDHKIPEPLEKGILRSRHGVYVFKDGTARFDATDVPITHFRPREIGTPIEVLKELGYETDYKGRPLERENQLLELKCQDILLTENGGDYFLKVTRFLDDLLERFYGLKPFYNCGRKEDLIGHLVLGLAPHTSAAILGRIIGFTKTSVGYAHPYFHAAKRRNCDGDEDGVFLLLDALLNFSKYYLPSSRGGKMDAPLVLTTRLDPREVDGEAHNIDIVSGYPLEFYQATLRFAHPREVRDKIEIVADRLGKPEQYSGLGFTHDTADINAGPHVSAYKTLGTMPEKVQAQLALASKIRAVDERDVARRVVESHFLPDLAGNLRSFSKQTVRCVVCNSKYRRVPLSGKCRDCGGKLVLTVHKGSVAKYLEVTKDLIEKYELEDYLRQRVKILEMSIDSVFQNDGVKQVSLGDFI